MARKCFTETMAILIYYEMENSKARRQFQNNVQAVIDVIQWIKVATENSVTLDLV